MRQSVIAWRQNARTSAGVRFTQVGASFGGLIGNALFLGGDTTTSRAIIQSGGDAFRIEVKDAKAEFKLAGVFQEMMPRFTQALMTRISQTAVCNRLHPVEKQLCRRLLLSHDCLDSNYYYQYLSVVLSSLHIQFSTSGLV